jgi:hypothetical protein
MSGKGADFSDIQPRGETGSLNIGFQQLTSGAEGVHLGEIQQVTQNNVFRLGQQIFFWIGLQCVTSQEGDYLTRVRLKPWWARPANEFRQAFGGNGTPSGAIGEAQAVPIDRVVFGNGAGGDPDGLFDNRYVWMPSPKRLDVTQYQTPPPPVAPDRHSDSVMLDDIWTVDMPDPFDATFAAKFVSPQVPSRWVPILYPAFGYALGFTWEVETFSGSPLLPRVSVSWAAGTLGSGRVEESVG